MIATGMRNCCEWQVWSVGLGLFGTPNGCHLCLKASGRPQQWYTCAVACLSAVHASHRICGQTDWPEFLYLWVVFLFMPLNLASGAGGGKQAECVCNDVFIFRFTFLYRCYWNVLFFIDCSYYYYYYWSLLYSAVLRCWADSLRSHVILHEWIAFYSAFLNIHWSGVLTALAWLVPQETAAISARSVYTIQPCTMSLHTKPHT